MHPAQPLDLLVAVAGEPQRDLVFPVGRQVEARRRPAARAGRQVRQVQLLREVHRHLMGLGQGLLRHPADGGGGDALRGAEIALKQRRRELADGHVVKTVADLVLRQQRGHVGVEREEVAHGVVVFCAREPAERGGAAGLWLPRGVVVERRLQVGEQPVVGGLVGARLAHRRHLAVAELLHDALPALRVGRGIGQGGRIEPHPALLGAGVVAVQAVFLNGRDRKGPRVARRFRRPGRCRPGGGRDHQAGPNRRAPGQSQDCAWPALGRHNVLFTWHLKNLENAHGSVGRLGGRVAVNAAFGREGRRSG